MTMILYSHNRFISKEARQFRPRQFRPFSRDGSPLQFKLSGRRSFHTVRPLTLQLQ
jgi:hypothetical protein